MRRIIALVGLTVATLFGVHLWAKAERFQLFGRLVARVETSDRILALTFDDGPEPEPTRELLDVLARHRVRATFFLQGAKIEEHRESARAIVAAGHEVGNHSYSHRRMILKTPAWIAEEIERTDRAIRSAGYRGEILFRPPFGKKLIGLPWYLREHGRTTIMWDIAPNTPPGTTAESLQTFILERVRPGSIVLLHPMYPNRCVTLAAVSGLITRLQTQGYGFVTVSDLLRRH